MENSRGYCVLLLSPPSRRSGLKSNASRDCETVLPSPPSRRSGLKLTGIYIRLRQISVSALAAEWIEIKCYPYICPQRICLRPRGGVD